jgi:arabinofuranan 3-O-arabinosyltransferase
LRHVQQLQASFEGDRIFTKDFLPIYVVSKAVGTGLEPFRPINQLAERVIPGLPSTPFHHPTPHPPTLAVLALPLTQLDYAAALVVWLWLELFCLVTALFLLWRASRHPLPYWTIPILAISGLAWFPLHDDLRWGQVNPLLLACLAGMWLAWRAERPLAAGALLGLALLIKQIAWPLVLYFVLRRAWRVVAGAIMVSIGGYGAATAFIGLPAMRTYVVEALPQAVHSWQRELYNQSLWSLGPRLFADAQDVAMPLFHAPALAPVASGAITAAALFLACRAAFRLPTEWGIGVMVCVSTIVNPIAWQHYWVLALLPATLVARWLIAHDFPIRETNLAAAIGLLMLIGYPRWGALASRVAELPAFQESDSPALPFAPALLALGPLVTMVLLASLMVYLGRRAYQVG